MSDKKRKIFRDVVPAIVLTIGMPLFTIAAPIIFLIRTLINLMRGKKIESESLSEEQLAYYLASAKEGNERAQWKLGRNYEIGCDACSNYKEAMKWYEMAALNGNIDAQLKMGELLESDFEGAPNYEEAIEWYRLAASEGNAYAQFRLGKMFANGEGVEQDDIQAYMWCKLADRLQIRLQGCDYTLERGIDKALNELKRRMTDSQIEQAEELVQESYIEFS